MHRLAGLIVLALALSACGLKGDLYLPPPEPEATAPTGKDTQDTDDDEPADTPPKSTDPAASGP